MTLPIPAEMKPEKIRFLVALREVGIIKYACEAASISRDTAYRWKREDEDFNAAWEQAIEDGTDELERAAIARAKEGSDKLLMFLLTARRPGIYGRRIQHSGDPDQPIRHSHEYAPIDLSKLSEEARREVLAAYPDEEFYPEEDRAEAQEGEYREIEAPEDEDDEWDPDTEGA